jgi:hypothetical protein
MTIAISLVVGDGVVLGTDSATSIIGEGERYFNIYANAEKTINLVKGLPVGLMTYGLGSIGNLSIASLGRMLRDVLSGDHPSDPDLTLDPDRYTLKGVAEAVKEFYYDNLYVTYYGEPPEEKEGEGEGVAEHPGQEDDPAETPPRFPLLGLVVAGFSAGVYYPEVWTIEVRDGRCEGPTRVVSPGTVGVIKFWAQPEPLNRLIYGWSNEAAERLLQAGLPDDTVRAILVAETPLAHPGMPIQDAVDLVRYLSEVTAGYLRFKPGAPVVGPPFDIAAITRHQGFKWVSRKHYYRTELNPVEYKFSPRRKANDHGAPDAERIEVPAPAAGESAESTTPASPE